MQVSFDGIVFNVLFLNAWAQHAIMSEDGADFLWWHHLIDVTVVLNPGATAAGQFPRLRRNNAVLKRENPTKDISTRTKIGQSSGLVFPGTTIGETPLKTKIPVANRVPPQEIPNPIGTKTFYYDLAGNQSERRGNDPTYPPATSIVSGMPYATDLAEKVGRVEEAAGGNWQSPVPVVTTTTDLRLTEIASPGQVEAARLKGTSPLVIPKNNAPDLAYAANTREGQPVPIPANYIPGGSKSLKDAIAGVLGSLGLPKTNEIINSAIDAVDKGPEGVAKAIRDAAAKVPGAGTLLGPLLTPTLPSAEDILKKLKEVDEIFNGSPLPENPLIVPPPPPRIEPREPDIKNENPPPFAFNSNLPATEVELRDRLKMPRRELLVWVNSGLAGTPEYMLAQPWFGYDSDAQHGPTCREATMTQVIGNVTGVKRLVFETFEGPAPDFLDEEYIKLRVRARAGANGKGVPPALVSNRWKMRQQPDPKTFLNTTIIEGKAVFRMDVLNKLHLTADQLRPYIMPPVASGYVRDVPIVAMGSGGGEVEYTIVDHQTMLQNPSGQLWGVHNVVLVDELTLNHPIDLAGKLYAEERDAPRRYPPR